MAATNIQRDRLQLLKPLLTENTNQITLMQVIQTKEMLTSSPISMMQFAHRRHTFDCRWWCGRLYGG